MFKREEASRVRQEFWTTFGRYMSPILSSEGEPINWINYHTGIKDIYFRMNADTRSAMIGISIEHRDLDVQSSYFERFKEAKLILENFLDEEWTWEQLLESNGRTISRIFIELPHVSIMNKDTWPDIISFLKPRIIALDAFWETTKLSFE